MLVGCRLGWDTKEAGGPNQSPSLISSHCSIQICALSASNHGYITRHKQVHPCYHPMLLKNYTDSKLHDGGSVGYCQWGSVLTWWQYHTCEQTIMSRSKVYTKIFGGDKGGILIEISTILCISIKLLSCIILNPWLSVAQCCSDHWLDGARSESKDNI